MTTVVKKRTRKVRYFMKDEETGEQLKREKEIEVDPREVEARSFVVELSRSYAASINYYEKFGEKDPESARKQPASLREFDREKVQNMPVQEIEWRHLSAVGETDMGAALELWEKIRCEARDWIESGTHCTTAICERSTPFQRAQIFALREQMAEGWNPQNGIEHALIDMLTQSYLLHLHWTGIAHEWATREAEKIEGSKGKSPYRHEQSWKLLRIDEGECIDRAHRLADGYHRQFMRTLRQLRDLRRYVPPVIVNNGGQVNVANQQVSVTQKE